MIPFTGVGAMRVSNTANAVARNLEKGRRRLDLSNVYINLDQYTEEDFKQGNLA